MTTIPIRTPSRAVEVAWFSALCSDDYELLGVVPNDSLRSSFQHFAETCSPGRSVGYQNVLLPSGWIAGQDGADLCSGHDHTDSSDQPTGCAAQV